jgi:hypothetical protein
VEAHEGADLRFESAVVPRCSTRPARCGAAHVDTAQRAGADGGRVGSTAEVRSSPFGGGERGSHLRAQAHGAVVTLGSARGSVELQPEPWPRALPRAG